MWHQQRRGWIRPRLNESPSQKEGKCASCTARRSMSSRLNESPSKKEGKYPLQPPLKPLVPASMKALPKRKGNIKRPTDEFKLVRLNESPSKKEGKCTCGLS